VLFFVAGEQNNDIQDSQQFEKDNFLFKNLTWLKNRGSRKQSTTNAKFKRIHWLRPTHPKDIEGFSYYVDCRTVSRRSTISHLFNIKHNNNNQRLTLDHATHSD
jgi:hypothetical protein